MTAKDIGNQPAYQTPDAIKSRRTQETFDMPCFPGLSKRDEFAMAAMQALIANPNPWFDEKMNPVQRTPIDCAETAVAYADALLAALAALAAEAEKGQP